MSWMEGKDYDAIKAAFLPDMMLMKRHTIDYLALLQSSGMRLIGSCQYVCWISRISGCEIVL